MAENESRLGQNLKPVKFEIQQGKQRDIQPTTKPNEFGQVFNADRDQSAAHVPSAQESVRQHNRSDVDSDRRAQHHTLGNTPNQSSPGDHIHDGILGKKLGPLEMDPANPGKTRPKLTCDATAAGIRTLLHNFIEFRDI